MKVGKLSALQDKTRPFSVCGTATKLILSQVERLLLPRNFVHRVQGDPGTITTGNGCSLPDAGPRSQIDRKSERFSLSWWTSNERYSSSLRRIFTNEISPFRVGKDLSIGTFYFKIHAKMISQRRFKAIDDYPSKFDWPGIKGLKTHFSSFSDGSCWEIIIIKQIHTFTSNVLFQQRRFGLVCPSLYQVFDLIKAGDTQTETSFIKHDVAGECVDLLDDISEFFMQSSPELEVYLLYEECPKWNHISEIWDCYSLR